MQVSQVNDHIDKRKHSVEDLLKFMERGDLPIADDGSVIIYKVLKRQGDRTDGKYVDCHSGKVAQWTGAYVCMDENLVDPNRRNECSNGLHVARRGYISGFSGFSGDVCVLAKLAPEDVIAVPEYDANKMRVCGYHILMELSDTQYELLRKNRPITEDPEGKKLLANALAGNHIHRTHEVRITGQMGAGVKVTPLEKPKTMADVPATLISDAAEATKHFSEDELEKYTEEQKQKKAEPVIKPVEALSNPEKKKETKVDVKAISLNVAQLSRKENAAALFKIWRNTGSTEALDELRELKKASKVSWDKLGVQDPATMPAVRVRKPKPGIKAVVVAEKGKKSSKTAVVENTGSPRERIQKLISIGLNQETANAITEIKRKAKKSFTDLGLNQTQINKIIKLTS
jgi:hypothetical protein